MKKIENIEKIEINKDFFDNILEFPNKIAGLVAMFNKENSYVDDRNILNISDLMFECPHCGNTTKQKLNFHDGGCGNFDNTDICGLCYTFCDICNEFTIWYCLDYSTLYKIYPEKSTISIPPHKDMPEDIKKIYMEALQIADKSPRAAAGLLRLIIEKICEQATGKKVGNLNATILSLAEAGMGDLTKKSLEIIKNIGNDSMHGNGQINLSDNIETVSALFEIANHACDDLIYRPKMIEKLGIFTNKTTASDKTKN